MCSHALQQQRNELDSLLNVCGPRLKGPSRAGVSQLCQAMVNAGICMHPASPQSPSGSSRGRAVCTGHGCWPVV